VPGLGEDLGELGEPLQGDGLDEVLHRGEVLVDHRLAVLDLGGQPARRHRLPALPLGEQSGGGGDEPTAGVALAGPTVRGGHA
jgi:hypothetical protein